MAQGKLEFHPSSSGEVAYVSLPEHPGSGAPGATKRQVRLRDLEPNYKGGDLFFDFDEKGQLIGIEILL